MFSVGSINQCHANSELPLKFIMRNKKPLAHLVTPPSTSFPEVLKERACFYMCILAVQACVPTVWNIPEPCGSSLFWYFKTNTRVITNSNDSHDPNSD